MKRWKELGCPLISTPAAHMHVHTHMRTHTWVKYLATTWSGMMTSCHLLTKTRHRSAHIPILDKLDEKRGNFQAYWERSSHAEVTRRRPSAPTVCKNQLKGNEVYGHTHTNYFMFTTILAECSSRAGALCRGPHVLVHALSHDLLAASLWVKTGDTNHKIKTRENSFSSEHVGWCMPLGTRGRCKVNIANAGPTSAI